MSKQKKTEIKDKLLCYLCESEKGSTQVSDIVDELNISHDLVFTLTTEFEERGFVRSIETSTKDALRRDKAIIVESKGRVFFNDGGYTEEEKEKGKSRRKESINTTLDNAYKVVAILGVIGTLGFGVYSCNLNEKINSLEKELNDLKINRDNSLEVIYNSPINSEEDTSSVRKRAR